MSATRSRGEALIGTELSHYRVLSKLGEGGMGEVYRAEDTRLGRQVALKLLPAAVMADAQARARFLAEARALAALDHPHICMLYELGEAGGQPFLAMQLVEGETLRDAIRKGPLSEARAREVIAAVAAALVAAHERGIVHRDVKSENILLGSDGGIKLADFGIARLTGTLHRLTDAEALMGTPGYAAPEVVLGGAAGPPADQFSLAAVAYETVTGTQPFAGDTLAATLHAVLHAAPTAPSRVRPGLPAHWDGTLMRALDKDPTQRFSSIEAFARAFQGGGLGRQAAREPGSVAVLYFENMSHEAEAEYFCAGVTEDLLTDLAKIQDLKVASRNAVARFRGQPVDIPMVASQLGVATVLEGSVRKSGNRVRITTQLIDAVSGFHLWAERYDRTLDDVFAVQEDIARSITAALRGRFTPEIRADLARGRPRDARAYDRYLKGRAFYRRYTHEENLKALDCFEQALALEPEYALAWAGVADACGQMLDKSYDLDHTWVERGLAAARRAIELGPDLPEPHKALALVHMVSHDYPAANDALRRAIEADPRYTPALANLGVSRMVTGDLAGTERCYRKVLEIDPADAYVRWILTILLFNTGRYEEAIREADRFQAQDPGRFYQFHAYLCRMIARARLRDPAGARREWEAAERIGLVPSVLDAAEAFVMAAAGDRAAALRRLEALAPGAVSEAVTAWLAVETLVLCGEAAKAVEWMEELERLTPLEWLHAHALLRVRAGLHPSLVTHPGFERWIGERGRRIVWPLEAPPLAPALRREFTDYSEATGLPHGQEEL